MVDLMEQGRWGRAEGTNGLATCVGMVFLDTALDGPRVAHIDCATPVRNPRDPMFQQVANWVTSFLVTAGRNPSPNYACSLVTSNVKEPSALAIVAGIRAWLPATFLSPLYEFDGFVIDGNLNPQRLAGHDANNTPGDGAFSVPDLRGGGALRHRAKPS